MVDMSSYPVTYTGYYDGESRPVRGVVPLEEIIPLHVNGQPLLRLTCTPTQLEDLALGFLYNAGLIESLDEVDSVNVPALPDGGCWMDVWLHHEIEPPSLRTLTSGCSGGTVFGDGLEALRRVESALRVTPQQVTRLMEELDRSAVLYRRAGGLHSAALGEGELLLCVAEDVGRHNALDKIAGTCLRLGRSTRDRILLTSGRISSEMVIKAARMAAPIVISRTAPTSLSIRLAQAQGLTLIGYTRRRSFRVYAGEEHVDAPQRLPPG